MNASCMAPPGTLSKTLPVHKQHCGVVMPPLSNTETHTLAQVSGHLPGCRAKNLMSLLFLPKEQQLSISRGPFTCVPELELLHSVRAGNNPGCSLYVYIYGHCLTGHGRTSRLGVHVSPCGIELGEHVLIGCIGHAASKDSATLPIPHFKNLAIFILCSHDH